MNHTFASAPGDMDAAVQHARNRWHRFVRNGPSRGGLVAVHAGNKYLLMAYAPHRYRILGQIVAGRRLAHPHVSQLPGTRRTDDAPSSILVAPPASLRHQGAADSPHLVETPSALALGTQVENYASELEAVLQCQPTIGNHVNVLQHLLGYLKKRVPARERHGLLAIISAYQTVQLPLAAPIERIRHYARVHDINYLLIQTYLGAE